MDQKTIMNKKKIAKNPFCNEKGLFSIFPALHCCLHLAVQVDLPGPGVGVVLDGVVLAAGEHAADQTLGTGHSGGGGGLGLLLARLLHQGLHLGHTCSSSDDNGLTDDDQN